MNFITRFSPHQVVSVFLVFALLTYLPKAFAEKQSPYLIPKNHCVTYKVTAHNGAAGIRFMHDKGHFQRVNDGSINGKICNQKYVVAELSKRHPQTVVSMYIKNQKHSFLPGEQADRHAQNWYRKYIKVDTSPAIDRDGK